MDIRAHFVDVRIERALPKRSPERAPVSEVEGPAVDMAGTFERTATAPHSLCPAEILNLHRALGNRAVGALLARPAADAPPIQAKLAVNAPGDEHEQQADRVAEQVMRMPAVQGNEEGPEVMTTPRLAPRGNDSTEVGADLQQQLAAGRGQGQPLPSDLRSEFEAKFGTDFVGVRVHTDSRSDRLSRALRAEAFTSGQDLYFRKGAYDPRSPTGRRLIAHELTHVLQQNGTGARGPVNTGAVVQRSITVGTESRHFAYWQAQLGLREGAETWAVAKLDGTSHTDLPALRTAMMEYLEQNRHLYQAELAEKESAEKAKKAEKLAKEKAESPPVKLGDAVQHAWERHTREGIRSVGKVMTAYGGQFQHGAKVSVFPQDYTRERLRGMADDITGAGFRSRGGGEYTKTQWIDDVNVQVIATLIGHDYHVNTFFPALSKYEIDWAEAETWAAEGRRQAAEKQTAPRRPTSTQSPRQPSGPTSRQGRKKF